MTADKLTELAALCEQATGPDRALGGAIWLAVLADEKAERAYAEGLKISKQEAAFRLDYMSDGARLTASLDAALTLVPEGATWELDAGADCSTATVFAPCLDEPGWVTDEPGQAATPALALCAAALRARSQSLARGQV